MKIITKYLFLFSVGGLIYILIELLYRANSHWTMFLLGGTCFIILGLLNEVIPWKMPIWQQVAIGDIFVTCLELLTGYVVNIKLGWNVWDYSGLAFNFMGQVSLLFSVMWIPICAFGIILDDWLRYWFFGQDKPHYKLF